MVEIFLGPIPFMFNISITPFGVLSTNSSKTFNEPVSKISIIFFPDDSPMPFISKIFSLGVSLNCNGNFSILKAAIAYDFALKLFSACMSVNLLKRLKMSAIW